MSLCRQAQPAACTELNDLVSGAPGAPMVTQPDLLLKPLAVSVCCFLVTVAVALGRLTQPAEARVILANGARQFSISR